MFLDIMNKKEEQSTSYMSNFRNLVRTIGSVLVLGGVGGGEIVSWDEMEDVDENDTAPQHTHTHTYTRTTRTQ